MVTINKLTQSDIYIIDRLMIAIQTNIRTLIENSRGVQYRCIFTYEYAALGAGNDSE